MQRRLEQFTFDPEGDDVRGLVALAERFDKRAGAIAGDKNLSSIGRNNRLLTAAQETHAAVVAWEERHVGVFDARIASETEALRLVGEPAAPSDPLERLTREIRHSEIRQNFAHLDPLEIQTLYFEAPEEVRDAIASAPPVAVKTAHGLELVPLVPVEVINHHSLGTAEIANPEAASQIRELQELRGTNAGLASAFKAALRDVAPGRIETDDPIAEQAAATTSAR